jgi:hypothetical protein
MEFIENEEKISAAVKVARSSLSQNGRYKIKVSPR